MTCLIKKSEVRISDYNPAILLAWEGNIYIGECSAVLCTKYATKAEKRHANTAFTDIASN